MEVDADETEAPTKLDIGFAWTDQGRKLQVARILKTTATGLKPTASVNATPACIIPAGHNMPLKIATSGWKSRPLTQHLDNEKWTRLVRQFSKAVGFKIPCSIRDTPMSKGLVPENNGRYMACHAEKKLGLFYLNMQIRHAGISFEDALKGKLREANLPLHRRQARIYLGHRPCKNCRDFLRLIRKRTGIDVRWTQSALFTEHMRDRSFKLLAPRLINVAPTPELEEAEVETKIKEEDDGNDTENEAGPMKKSSHNAHDYLEIEESIIESVEVDELEQIEEVIETLPVGNVKRPRQIQMPVRSARDKERDKAAMPPPAFTNASRMSVQSSPSPSISMVSVVESIVPRNQRYSTYSSPSRRDDSVAPPSVWGGRSKPPVTACLVPPDEFSGLYENGMATSSPSQPSQPANGTSYFFGTPSVASTQATDSQRTHPEQPHRNNRVQSRVESRVESRARGRIPGGTAYPPRTQTLASSYNMARAASPPPQVYVPPYLRRLRRPLYTDRAATNGNNRRTRPAINPQIVRSPTPVIDLTEPAAHDDDVEFLNATASPGIVVRDSSASSSGSNDSNIWHPPMRRVTSGRSVEPHVPIPRVRQVSRPVRPNQRQQTARRRGVAVPVRRRRGQARNNFPDLSAYHYTEPEEI